jgi:hypothetical protein
VLIVPHGGRAIEVEPDPQVAIRQMAEYLAEYASRDQLVDTARVLSLLLDSFAAGCQREILVPPGSVTATAHDLTAWSSEVSPVLIPRS